jgi:hypothetical protein
VRWCRCVNGESDQVEAKLCVLNCQSGENGVDSRGVSGVRWLNQEN